MKGTQGGPPTKILIVDAHPILREGLAMCLRRESDMMVCGEADNTTDALKLVDESGPDVVVVDISLSGSSGLDLIKQLRGRDSAVKVLVYSTYDETVYAERAMDAGAYGYINKRSATNVVVHAIRTVRNGDVYLSRDMTKRLLRARVGAKSTVDHSRIEDLSSRELEVLQFIGHGLSTRAIATEMNLSVHTVDTYREKIKLKLQLADSPQLARYAVQWVLENE